MAVQTTMFDLWAPPPVDEAPKRRLRLDAVIRAYGGPHQIHRYADDPEPFEIEVRGIRTAIAYSGGFCTYVIDGPGSTFWSETGFRSFGVYTDDPAEVAACIEQYIDRPPKDGNGCGGKLTRWWPRYVLRWRSDRAWSLTHERATMWTQWGPDEHERIWRTHDERIAGAEARMWAEGIDPNDVEKPAHHKGPWLVVARPEAQGE